MSEKIYLGLGSNSGDSIAILRGAVADLGSHLEAIRVSSLWYSAPRYVLDQPPYYNLVIEASTTLEPEQLLGLTSGIETKHGRDRSKERPKGPRSLDIDILLVGEQVLETEGLVIPHPGIEERKFVLLPLLELARDLRNPRSGRAFLMSLADLGPQGIYLVSPDDYDRFRF